MPELVQQHAGPELVRAQVAEHANVARAVDVHAERVLALALPLVQIRAGEDRSHVESHRREEARPELLDRATVEPGIEVEVG